MRSQPGPQLQPYTARDKHDSVIMGSSEALVKKVALNECKKVFIQRDYGQGLAVAFCTGYPDELSGKVSHLKSRHTTYAHPHSFVLLRR